jgi:hypothetical protein
MQMMLRLYIRAPAPVKLALSRSIGQDAHYLGQVFTGKL